MKKLSFLLVVMVFAAFGSANAYYITYDYVGVGGLPSSPVPGAIVNTFDPSPGLPWTYEGSYTITSGSASGLYAAPWNFIAPTGQDTTNYISVPKPNDGTGSVRVTNLGGFYSYFGIWWGSMDTYNTLEFYNGNTLVASVTGSEVANPSANGNQTFGGTNRYVNIFFNWNTEKFDNFIMKSTQYAFEADNIALATPEPVSMLLFGTGLLGVGGYIRRKFKK